MPVTAGILQFMLRGDTAQFEKDMAKGGKAIKKLEKDAKDGGAGIVKGLKGALGEESGLGNIGKILRGGGAVAGIGLVAHELAAVTATIDEFAMQARESGTSFKAFTDDIVRGLPILGDLRKAGLSIRGWITGEQSDAEIANLAKKATEFQDFLQRIRDKTHEAPTEFDALRKEAASMGLDVQQAKMAEALIVAAEKYKDQVESAKQLKELEKQRYDAEKARQGSVNAVVIGLRNQIDALTMTREEQELFNLQVANAKPFEREIVQLMQKQREELEYQAEAERVMNDGAREAAEERRAIMQNEVDNRNTLIDRAAAFTDTIRAAGNALPGFHEAGSADAISAINRANSSNQQDETAIAKAALEAAMKQIQIQGESRALLKALVEGGKYEGHNT